MKWASAAGQKGNVFNLRKVPRFPASLFSCFVRSNKKKERNPSSFLTVQFKIKAILFFLFFPTVWQMRRPPETVLVLGSYASLACPEIRSRGAAGNSGEARPSVMYHPLYLATKCFHAQTHTSFQLKCFLSGKCRSATLLFQIQSNHNTKG